MGSVEAGDAVVADHEADVASVLADATHGTYEAAELSAVAVDYGKLDGTSVSYCSSHSSHASGT